jgi:hypothetical protein
MKKNPFNNKLFAFMTAMMLFAMGGCMNESLNDADPNVTLHEELDLLEDNDEGANLRINPSIQNRILAEVRKVTAKYHRLEVAESDGYALDPHCVEVPGLGGMGHHAANFGLVDDIVDPSNPEVLLYEPGKNGQYKLVAVEFLVVAAPWDAQNDGPPMLGSVEFADHREIIMVDGNPVNAKGGPPFPHYQLHTWVWKNNPSGMYFPFNPTVSCSYAADM